MRILKRLKKFSFEKVFIFLVIVLFSKNVMAEEFTLSVPAQPVWTDTGIELSIGDKVIITATGNWNYGYYPLTANGDQPWEYPNTWDRFLYQANHGELIAYIGDDPYQGRWGDSTFFPQTTGYWRVGTYNEIISDKVGRLWLGMNDDAVSKCDGDNSGALNVNLLVIKGAIEIVNIDIKPDSFPNSINLKSKGVVPVALFGNESFNVREVILERVSFAGAKNSNKVNVVDINKDGYSDLVFHFDTQALKLADTSTKACLSGITKDEKSFYGCDTIKIVNK